MFLCQILSDISNTYVLDFNRSESGKQEAFVASNSIPSYQIDTDKIHADLTNPTVSGGNFQSYNSLTNKYSIISFPSSVPFKTGDEISYNYDKGVEKDEKYIVCMPVCQS